MTEPKYPTDPALGSSHEYGKWKTPYGLDNPPDELVTLIEEWDGDRIDDRILIDYLAEVAEIPIPSDEELDRIGNDPEAAPIDRRLYYPIYVARAAVRAYERLERVAESDEFVSNNLSPKVVLDSAIVWDRG